MPPSAVVLPPRANAFRYSDEDVQSVLTLFGTIPAGQAVALQDDPEDTENKARRKCQIIREQIEALPPVDVTDPDTGEPTGETAPVIHSDYYVRGHVLPVGEATGKKTEGNRTITLYGKYMPAVSLSKRAEQAPDEPDAAAPDEPPASDAPDAPDTTAPKRAAKRAPSA